MEEWGLWPAKGLNLCCHNPQCFNNSVTANCKICAKNYKCDICKILWECRLTNRSKNWRCDICVHRQEICGYITKKYYTIYRVKTGKYEDCEELIPKSIINNNNFFVKIKSMLIKAISKLCQVSPFNWAWFSIIKMRNQRV